MFFRRVPGNGGNWIELVVTSNHVDMRGWRVATGEDANQNRESVGQVDDLPQLLPTIHNAGKDVLTPSSDSQIRRWRIGITSTYPKAAGQANG